MGPMLFGPTWPERMLRGGFALSLLISSALFLGLILELSAPAWSRPALLLQLAALLCGSGLMLAHQRRSPRWLLYPVLLAATVYLWDTTLPPPTLPEGQARGVVPRLVLLALLTDALLSIRHHLRQASVVRLVRRAPAQLARAIPVRNGLVPLVAIAELFEVTPDELVARLRRRGRRPVDTPDRGASLWLADLLLVLRYWHEDGPAHPAAAPPDHDHLPR